MYMIGAAFMGIFGFIYFAMLNTGIPWVIFVAIALSLVPVMTQYGPEAALIAESFSPRLRYSGTSIGYQLGLDHRRRPVADHRDLAVRDLSFQPADRDLHRAVGDHRHHRDVDADGLHQQGHIGRICRGLNQKGRRRSDAGQQHKGGRIMQRGTSLTGIKPVPSLPAAEARPIGPDEPGGVSRAV